MCLVFAGCGRLHFEPVEGSSDAPASIPGPVVPPANDSGFEPNRSVLPPGTRYAERSAFAREFRVARGLEATDPARSRALYEALLARQRLLELGLDTHPIEEIRIV